MRRGLRAGVVFVAAGLASGCAVNQGVEEVASPDVLVTESVAQANRPGGVSETDARVITDTVAKAPAGAPVRPLAWSNPSTGSSGTIMAIDAFLGKHGQSCKGFKTSVSSFMGIALYDGEACQISPGEWVLSFFRSSDGA